MDVDELTLMESQVAEARRLVAEVRALGEDTSTVEALVVQLELLLTTMRDERSGHSDRRGRPGAKTDPPVSTR